MIVGLFLPYVIVHTRSLLTLMRISRRWIWSAALRARREGSGAPRQMPTPHMSRGVPLLQPLLQGGGGGMRYIHTDMHTYIMYIYLHTHTHTHTHVCMYIHTHTHTGLLGGLSAAAHAS